MSTKTTKPASKSNAKSSEKTPSPSKTAGNKGKKPAAKSTLTAATITPPTSKIAAPKQVPIVSVMGQMIDTQEIANRLGRNWQFVNRQRHAGNFIDHSAVLKTGGTYLYKVSAVRAWAKQNGYPFGSN